MFCVCDIVYSVLYIMYSVSDIMYSVPDIIYSVLDIIYSVCDNLYTRIHCPDDVLPKNLSLSEYLNQPTFTIERETEL